MQDHPTLVIARREFIEKIMSRYVWTLVALYALISVSYGVLDYNDAVTPHIPIVNLFLPANSYLLTDFYVVYVFGPLFVIALAFDSLSREKVTKSLHLLLSYPISRWSVLNGKVLGIGAIFLPIATFLPLGIFAISVHLMGQLSVDFAFRLASVGVLEALYLTFWFVLSILVSAVTSKPGDSLAACIGLWLLFQPAFLPSIIPMIITTLLWPGQPLTSLISNPNFFALNNQLNSIFPPFHFMNALYGTYVYSGALSSLQPVGMNYVLNTSLTFYGWLSFAWSDFLVLVASVALLAFMSVWALGRMNVA